jgi:DNA-binding NtrC family response regulator
MLDAPAIGLAEDHCTPSGRDMDHGFGPPQQQVDVLVLEDDPMCGHVVCEILRREGATPWIFQTVAEARNAIRNREFDFFILDHKLPDGTGTAFYYSLLEQIEFAPAIMLTGVPDITKAVELTKTGLLNYLAKPFSLEQFRTCLAQGLAQRIIRHTETTQPLSSVSQGMRQVYRQARLAAANYQSTVLLTGETGVGKDVLARTIHELSQRHPDIAQPFISLNCAALPGEMFESELFGAERGAYTGAHQRRAGLAEAADGGTLFLDEIGEVPLHLQAKLLHLLENREYRRLGEPTQRKFAGRIIAATNKSLQAAVQAGVFRADLLYRLDVFSIHVPALRERTEDIPVLSRTILSELAQKYSKRLPQMRSEDLELLSRHSFPGNVRELRNILERSLLETAPDSAWLHLSGEAKKKLGAKSSVNEKSVGIPVQNCTSVQATPQHRPLEIQERNLIREALKAEQGVIRRAAARLGMSHQALLRRLDKWPELRQPTEGRN